MCVFCAKTCAPICVPVNHHHTSPAVLVSFTFVSTQQPCWSPNGELLDRCCFTVCHRLTSVLLKITSTTGINVAICFHLLLSEVKITKGWELWNWILIHCCPLSKHTSQMYNIDR